MLKQAFALSALLTVSLCVETKTDTTTQVEGRRHKFVDPFAALDKHLTHTLAHHYLWPWNQFFQAAMAVDEDRVEEPELVSDDKLYTIKLFAKSYKPEELKVRVRNRDVIVEGKHSEGTGHHHLMSNHFVQRFILPPGTKQEEVKAVFNERGMLVITVPRHEVPPPPPEIEVPIEVRLPATTTTVKPSEKPEIAPVDAEKPVENKPMPDKLSPTADSSQNEEKHVDKKSTEEHIKKEKHTEDKKVTVKPKEELSKKELSTAAPIEKLEIIEATTHVGKIRKKELKEAKTKKENNVSKNYDGNTLDYLLVDSE